MDVYLTSPYLSFEFGVQHTVLQLARPSQGKKFIVYPRLMGYKYMEDVEAWLSSSRVESYMNYRFRPAGYTDSPKDVQSTVARRLEKMAAVWPMLGGEVMQERPCVNFTVEFDRKVLLVMSQCVSHTETLLRALYR